MARGLGKNRRGFANSAVTKTVPVSFSSDISLYLPFDSDLNDDSTNAFTGTAVNGASISTSVMKFGSGSLDLVSSGKYVDYPYDSVFDLGSDNWTFEAWIYQTTSDDASLFSQYSGGSGSTDYNYAFKITNNSPREFQFFWTKSNGSQDGHGWALEPAINVWNHVALVREGNQVHCFLNGVKGSGSANFNVTIRSSGSDNFSVGRSALAGYRGYIDDFRFTKGVAVYTSNFTPPTSSTGVNSITVENKFLSSVWSLKDQNKKISKGEWIRNDDGDTGVDAKGRVIKGAGLEVFGHRHSTSPGIAASGGSEVTTPTHIYHVFTSPGTFTMTGAQGQVEYLVVGGGGNGAPGGPSGFGGGGGAGGVRQGFLDPLTPGSYPVTVGDGGGSGWSPSTSNFNPSYNGSPSTFATITAAGGGAGGQTHGSMEAQDGGSGGGGGKDSYSSGAGNTPPTTPSQGNPGGDYPYNHPSGRQSAGGGGGAGGAGSPGQGGGHGGLGLTFSQFAAPIIGPAIGVNTDAYNAIGPTGLYGAGGGAGNSGGPAENLGQAGGGNAFPHVAPQRIGDGASTPNKSARSGHGGGNGGGGGSGQNPNDYDDGKEGGDGIVIIRYLI